MAYTAFRASGHAHNAQQPEETASVAGLIAAAVWVVGLAVGAIALAVGQPTMAAVALVLAVAAPWFGLVWVSRSRRVALRSRPVSGHTAAGHVSANPLTF